MEAAPGFEPGNNGFAIHRLSHLAMPPLEAENVGLEGGSVEAELPGVGAADTPIGAGPNAGCATSCATPQPIPVQNGVTSSPSESEILTPRELRDQVAEGLERAEQMELAAVIRAWDRLAPASRRAVRSLVETLDEGSTEDAGGAE